MVGLGWWGRHLVKSVAGSDRIEIVRLTSRSPRGHQTFSDEMDIPLADSYRHVLEDPDVDAVILCTPRLHVSVQMLAFRGDPGERRAHA